MNRLLQERNDASLFVTMAGGTPQTDDIAVVVLRYLEPAQA